ncbi:MAG TPA: alpha/beta hydrolase fold domain-containing protein, partial [Rugosimonospora sp.]|nr:alpha/beta hydrolase fold domain-containing protein [Rugosimonospora sp.]
MDPTRLHPQARAALAVQQRAPLTVPALAEVRHSMSAATAVEVGPGPAVETVLDVDAHGVPARLYRDGAAARTPIVVFAHGGGWVMGGLDTHDGLCRHLVAASGWAVLAVDYRLAPEHPFPAALDDVYTVLLWAAGHAAELGFDPERIAVAGHSAGGGLAAAVALRA